jgi:hypothetical protein
MLNTSNISAYYKASLAVLRHLEQRRPTDRRFGPNADARWQTFQGDLTTTDRLDLLIRDANAEWPGALGAAATFGLRAVAEDEAFGAEWTPIDAVEGEEIWRSAGTPESLGEVLDAVAGYWDIKLSGAVAVGEISPAEKLVVVGPSAIASVIAAFAEGRDLDWADQVVCVASAPGHRQLAAVATALLNLNKRAEVCSPATAPALQGRRLIMSDDAHVDDRAWTNGFTGAS